MEEEAAVTLSFPNPNLSRNRNRFGKEGEITITRTIEITAMKSSYELAMERLKQTEDAGFGDEYHPVVLNVIDPL